MLFNSVEFIFIFLPLTFVGFFLLARVARTNLAVGWLVLASFVFYGWFHLAYLALFVFSILFNFLWARFIGHMLDVGRLTAKIAMGVGILVNLGLIAYYKYANFFVDSANRAFGSNWLLEDVLLPIGISFFTFQQITFLVDRYKEKVGDPPFLDYCLFVSFFPQLVAGPIVHHSDVLPQFEQAEVYRFNSEGFFNGVTIFCLGLFKKVVLADQFAIYANRVFDVAKTDVPLTLFEAWGGSLSFTLQLYFDFSGYSDMAIGLGLMIGIALPLNFCSPYKATSIIDFWRRWHITLSRFLRDYLYVPLGGSRVGRSRRYVNLMVTMVLGGLWHGAGWTFVFWGALHGIYLVINHFWVWLCGTMRIPHRFLNSHLWRVVAWLLTMLAVVVGWVFFRAESFASALAVLAGMAGLNGALLPSQIVRLVPGLSSLVEPVGAVRNLADGTVMGFIEMSVLLGFALIVVVFGKHLHEMTPRSRYLLLIPTLAFTLQRVLFKPEAAQFIYFQF